MDADGITTGWNSGTSNVRVFGRRDDRPHGRHFVHAGRQENKVPAKDCTKPWAKGRAEDDRWHMRKDGSRFFAQGVTTPLADKGVTGFVKIARDLTTKMEAEAAVHKQEMLRRLVQSQEDERHRIARDLHDHLGQQMTVLRLSLGTLHESCSGDAKLQKQIADLQARATQIDNDVGFLALSLGRRPLTILDSRQRSENYVQEWSRNFQISADFHELRMGE